MPVVAVGQDEVPGFYSPGERGAGAAVRPGRGRGRPAGRGPPRARASARGSSSASRSRPRPRCRSRRARAAVERATAEADGGRGPRPGPHAVAAGPDRRADRRREPPGEHGAHRERRPGRRSPRHGADRARGGRRRLTAALDARVVGPKTLASLRASARYGPGTPAVHVAGGRGPGPRFLTACSSGEHSSGPTRSRVSDPAAGIPHRPTLSAGCNAGRAVARPSAAAADVRSPEVRLTGSGRERDAPRAPGSGARGGARHRRATARPTAAAGPHRPATSCRPSAAVFDGCTAIGTTGGFPGHGLGGRLRPRTERPLAGSPMSAQIMAPAIDARGIRRVYSRQARAGHRPRRRRPRGPAGRVLRPARTERRRQDDADQDPHHAPPAERRDGPRVRLRHRERDQEDPPDHEHGRRRGAVGLRDPDRPRAALDVQPVLRPGQPRGLEPGRRADRGGRPRGAAPAAGEHPVDRPAPEDELRPRPAQRPVDPVPRRADARSRRLRGARRSASSSPAGRRRYPAGRSS